MAKATISRAKVLKLFVVDLKTGRLFWREPPKNHPRLLGQEAGSSRPNHHGKFYWVVKIERRAWKRAQLIHLIAKWRLPRPMVDHIDGDSLNDRPENLRSADVFQNAWNHKTRKRRIHLPMGVRINASSGRFGARISHYGKQIHLGSFSTADADSRAYQAKRKELYQEFA